jgi:hypothetical protein
LNACVRVCTRVRVRVAQVHSLAWDSTRGDVVGLTTLGLCGVNASNVQEPHMAAYQARFFRFSMLLPGVGVVGWACTFLQHHCTCWTGGLNGWLVYFAAPWIDWCSACVSYRPSRDVLQAINTRMADLHMRAAGWSLSRSLAWTWATVSCTSMTC